MGQSVRVDAPRRRKHGSTTRAPVAAIGHHSSPSRTGAVPAALQGRALSKRATTATVPEGSA
ncbi:MULTISPECIES: hypothetical protein [Streptomyces]|uniref:hypothetical protein n=1 Tax=Streptomyces TaxID=1883 RepID=UPI00131D5AEB|nr:hypothetical protein [Streptomyces virginiae]